MIPIRVLHPITRLIIGGAQENTMLTADLMNKGMVGGHFDRLSDGRYKVDIVSGPQTGPEGSLIEEVHQRGTSLTILPELRREISPLNDLRAVQKLRQMMQAGGYQIVHTHSSKAGVVGRWAAHLAGVPVIVHTVHGWSFHDQMSPVKRQMYVLLEKFGAQFSQALIVVSPQDIDKGLAQSIGRREDYHVIRSGVELDRFGHPAVPPQVMRQQLGIPMDALVVGSVTRLSPQKAPLDLVMAFAYIHQRQPEAWFVIVGDGSLRPEVEAGLQAAGIADRVILTGLRRDVPELMAMFDVFVLSSLWEGLPRVLPQAMATCLPIVTTRADGSAEAVVDGENGFLVARGQPEALAAKALVLLADEGLRRRMGENGRSRSLQFGAEKMVQDIHLLYQELLLR
ncbi:MAG: glycosyltransferase family 4 protein [Ardenticatenaceae bacterium]|nr:glycosyltransferase family 4 protein [Ardenticatenaceae bacterium]